MNYVPVVARYQTNAIVGTKDNIVAGPKDSEDDARMKPTEVDENETSDKNRKHDQDARSESERLNQREMQTEHTNSTNSINIVSTPVSTVGPSFDIVVPSPPVNTARPSVSTANAFEEHLFEIFSPFKNAFTLPPVPNVSSLDNTGIFRNVYDDEDMEEEVDMNNIISSYSVPDTSFTKFHKDRLEDQVIGIHKLRRTNHKDFQNCLFACFLSQREPKKPVQALKDPSWVEAMQDELLQFKMLKVWTLVDLPRDKWAIGIDYDEVFAPVARIEAIRLFLVYASFKDFVVYQMDVKSAFLYGKIEEEVYICQLPGFEDLYFPDKVYKVEKALYGLHQAPRAWFQVTPKTLHLNAVKRIFRYLKGQPKLGLWYPRDSPFDLEAFSDSDYAGASLDRKSTTGGCQFLGKRLISWQCKKQTIVANSTTEAEYVAAANCCGQVLWIQNQMLDYGFNFMNTKIYIDNESTICIVKNPVFHSKTKHIEIRHHFIRDSYEKKLIQVIKIHTDQNVADLLTKAFDASRVKTVKAKHIEYLVGDEAVHKELGDRMERAATTASSLEAEQDSGIGPRCQDTILENVDAQTRTSTARTSANGEVELTATIDGQVKTITEASLRIHLKLEDNGGITTLPNSEIFEQLALIGYVTDSDKLTFQKGHFFSSVEKVFSNMKRVSKGYSGIDFSLFPTMINAPETSPSRITSSPSLSPQHTPVSTPLTSQPPNTQPTPDAEEAASMPYESPLYSVHSLGRDEGSLSLNKLTDLCTSLSKKVEGLESELKRRARIVVSEDEDAPDDLQNRGGKLQRLIKTPLFHCDDTEVVLEEEEPTELWKIKVVVKKEKKKLVLWCKSHRIVIPEPEKNTKKQLEQERLGHEEAVRLQEQLNEEETQRIARDAEIAR
ncbi:putative ribonuclease H-like domain-containing protein [Tanacetum coccineum]